MPIPRHEPEIIAAEAKKRWHGDDEKVATTSIKELEVHGAALSSRYDKAHELEIMKLMMEQLSTDLRPRIKSIFCDSKAPASYSVTLGKCSEREAKEIARQLEHVCYEVDGGHNGLVLLGQAGGSLFIDPNWRGEGGFS